MTVRIEPLVRERFGFACDIGTSQPDLCRLWPHYDFAHLDERWWRHAEEPEAMLIERCAAFCAGMAERPDWRRVAVVTHWGVIRALTGITAANGQLIRFDPTRDREPAD